MVKDNHVYTLNNDIKTLEQKQDFEPEVLVRASPNFYTFEKADHIPCMMISSIDDILKIVKQLGEPDENTLINLIHANEDLVELWYELKEAGYEPAVKYECGRLTKLILKFNKIIFFHQSPATRYI